MQNTASIPVDFRHFIANRDTFFLHADTWDIGGEAPLLVKRDPVNLSLLGQEECDETASAGPASEDCKLLELISVFSPGGENALGQGGRVRTRPELFRVLFIDFPGEGPATWKRVYEDEYQRTDVSRRNAFPHAFVHPFISAAVDSSGQSQGTNNHEGDWEHINVVVAPPDRVAASLTAADIQDMLQGHWLEESKQAPLIRRVEYYFHHFVMVLDYTQPNVYLPRAEWKAEIEQRKQGRLLESEIWKAIRQMAYADENETQLNTHPIGYIGADNKGLDQVMVAPGGNNRDSHGTYPFSGRYHDIGAASATELVSAHVDSREYLQEVSRGKRDPGPSFRRGQVLQLADPERLTIVPDWERLAALVQSNAAVRREWSWLLLPILWGYPASQSPLAGIVENADTGNQAPVGPAFSGGWNASGAARGFGAYEPHHLPSIFPLGLQDSFRNDLGGSTPPIQFSSTCRRSISPRAS